MKFHLRKYERQQARKLKKQKKQEKYLNTNKKSKKTIKKQHPNTLDTDNLYENYEDHEDYYENQEDYNEQQEEYNEDQEEYNENQEEYNEDQENYNEERENDLDEIPDNEEYHKKDSEIIRLDKEIEELEVKLGLRKQKTRVREKNWKKIKKNLELDGFGADFYDLLEGKLGQDEEDEGSVHAPDSPEIEYADNFDDNERKKYQNEDEGEDDEEEGDEKRLDDDESEEDHDDGLWKKQKITEESEKKRFIPVGTSSEAEKRLKGLFNRLSDQNIEPLTGQITELFKNYSNSVLQTALWDFLNGTFSNQQTPTQLLAVYSVEVSALSRLVGREISAFIIDKLYKSRSSLNLTQISFLSYLYYFGVINSGIISGFLKLLLDDLTESHIEFLITSFNLIGFTLRKNEPSILKELITLAQEKCKKLGETTGRMKVMVETLMDVKNNKKKQNLAEDRLKFLKNWLKNNVCKKTGIKECQITAKFEDLEGSNWRNLLTPSFEFIQNHAKFSPEIEALARAQKMNTDSRRNIFCLLMSSEDYMDAFAKLSTLKKQERDIVRVIINCTGQEATYNKFYTLVSIQLCKEKNSYKYSFQYALWDFLKQFQDFSIRKISNIGKFFADMIVNGAVGLSILKAVDFDDINEHLSLFLRILIENVIVSSAVQSIEKLFNKVGKSEKLKNLAEGLRVFIKIVILKHPRKGVIEEIGKENFIKRVKISRKALKNKEI
ncbi:hypothetical protein SteCoe_32951 [Stentor coeruleus]|uniref:MI domain-containing protein n=1 Tax=Stentor coeruleus TaxID=5963 RepID=A0A1R2AXW9_9CILI|nr:hypothetical protein SteCoe_32951 [Stentor coeruleus]